MFSCLYATFVSHVFTGICYNISTNNKAAYSFYKQYTLYMYNVHVHDIVYIQVYK